MNIVKYQENAGVGVVIHDDKGSLMAALVKPFCFLYTPSTIELLAIKEVLYFYLQIGFKGGNKDCKVCLGFNYFLVKDIKHFLS